MLLMCLLVGLERSVEFHALKGREIDRQCSGAIVRNIIGIHVPARLDRGGHYYFAAVISFHLKGCGPADGIQNLRQAG